MNSSPLLPLRSNQLTRALILGGIGWIGIIASTLAADRTWTGGVGDFLWETAANWSGAPVTTGEDSLLFGSAGAGALTNGFNGASFGRIDFLAGAGAYTLGGNAITIGTLGFNNESSVEQVISFDVTLAGNLGDVSRFRAWGGDLRVDGVMSGNGRITTASGATGTVFLNNANTHAGGVTANSKLHLGNANALGTGIFTISGGSAVTFSTGIGTLPGARPIRTASAGGRWVSPVTW